MFSFSFNELHIPAFSHLSAYHLDLGEIILFQDFNTKETSASWAWNFKIQVKSKTGEGYACMFPKRSPRHKEL